MTERWTTTTGARPHAGSASADSGLCDTKVSDRGGRRVSRRQPGARGRVVVAGIGFTAMLALAANMEHNDARKASVDAARTAAAPRTLVVVHQGVAPASLTAAAKGAHHPIVLTARPVVRTITVVASGGGSAGYSAAPSGSSGSGYVAVSAGGGSSQSSAPAPVASSGGSKVH